MPADEVEIVPYQDGPYLVRGPVKLRDQDGRSIELGRRTIALCRCGRSKTRPFCDGTHQLIRFRVPSGAEEERSPRPHDGGTQTERPWRPPTANGSIHRRLQETTAPASAECDVDDQTAHALSLLHAARVVVQRGAADDGDPAPWTIPCTCLVRAAIETLAQAAGKNREIPKVIEQLAITVALLEGPA